MTIDYASKFCHLFSVVHIPMIRSYVIKLICHYIATSLCPHDPLYTMIVVPYIPMFLYVCMSKGPFIPMSLCPYNPMSLCPYVLNKMTLKIKKVDVNFEKSVLGTYE